MEQHARTIVFINGLWMTALSWEHWIERYSALGYHIVARSWPGMEGDIDEIRRDPSHLAGMGFSDVVDHYEKIVREFPKPPIIMGHSFGGLVTQILLDRGLGAAGVAIDSAPVKGVLLLPFSTIRVVWPALSNPANTHKAAALTREQFRYAFGNLMTEEESNATYDRYAVPGPDHLLFQAGLANFNPNAATSVNFQNNDRAPLLLIAGGKDHVVPASVTRANLNLYKRSEAVTDYREFPDRSHFTIGEPGWEEVADYAIKWAEESAAAYEATSPISQALPTNEASLQ